MAQEIDTVQIANNEAVYIVIPIVDADGAAVDISAWQFQAQGKTDYANTTPDMTFTVTKDTTNMRVVIYAPSTDVIALFPTGGALFYDLLALPPTLGTPVRLGHGIIAVVATGVTSWA